MNNTKINSNIIYLLLLCSMNTLSGIDYNALDRRLANDKIWAQSFQAEESVAKVAGLNPAHGTGPFSMSHAWGFQQLLDTQFFIDNPKMEKQLETDYGMTFPKKRRLEASQIPQRMVAVMVRRALGYDAFKNHNDREEKEKQLKKERDSKLKLLKGKCQEILDFIYNIFQNKELLQRSFIWVSGVIFFYHLFKSGIPMLLNVIFLKRPQIIKETSIPFGFWAWMKSWWRKPPRSRLKELRYAPELHVHIKNLIAYDRRRVQLFRGKRGRLPFHHMLLHGPPGTGKTALAIAYALEIGADYIIIGGARWSQMKPDEALQNFYELLAIARANGRPVVIFIDEAETLFGHRDGAEILDKKITNAFLEMNPKPSDPKIKWIISTNLRHKIDSAIESRIQCVIEIGPPPEAVCAKLFKHYLTKSCKRVGISCAFPREIGKALVGATGRDIEEFCKVIAEEAKLGKRKITPERVVAAVNAKKAAWAHDRKTKNKSKGKW